MRFKTDETQALKSKLNYYLKIDELEEMSNRSILSGMGELLDQQQSDLKAKTIFSYV